MRNMYTLEQSKIFIHDYLTSLDYDVTTFNNTPNKIHIKLEHQEQRGKILKFIITSNFNNYILKHELLTQDLLSEHLEALCISMSVCYIKYIQELKKGTKKDKKNYINIVV